MTVVVQPNVVTRDHKAGVQVGELIRVTQTGFERLHSAPRGFLGAPETSGPPLGFCLTDRLETRLFARRQSLAIRANNSSAS